MTVPSYKRPFSPDDFRGYFTWSKALTERLSANLYHACHEDIIEQLLEDEELPLRSKWSIHLPEHGLCEVPGVWTGLNYFAAGNKYGPFLVEFPLSVLNGRRFMAFRRKDTDRNRYFFVQYEALIPIFSFKGEIWRKVDSRSYFDKHDDDSYGCKIGAIYDVVLTQSISLEEAMSIRGVSHPSCIPGKCSGLTSVRARKAMVKIAAKEIRRRLKKKGILKRMLRKFPDLEDETIAVEFQE